MSTKYQTIGLREFWLVLLLVKTDESGLTDMKEMILKRKDGGASTQALQHIQPATC